LASGRSEDGSAQRPCPGRVTLLRELQHSILGPDPVRFVRTFSGCAETVISWQSARPDAMLNRYIRDGELFVGNAAGVVL
jgi:hypothetical protein